MALLSRVVCPHCHRLTLRGKFCINCGKELPAELVSEAQVPTQPVAQPAAEAPPQQAQQAQPTPVVQAQEPAVAEEVAEERKLVEQLSKLHTWSLKLVDIFTEGEVPLNVFTDLYDEYRSRITTLDQKRMEMVSRISERIQELTQRAESLKIRHEVNEISDRDYIRQKIEIDKELSRLRPKLSILENPLEIRLADIPAFTEGLSKRIENLRAKGDAIGLSQKRVEEIIKDMQALLDACQGLVQQHAKIQHEIKKLETRYKIGELKQDEYLAQRQRLERQLELTF